MRTLFVAMLIPLVAVGFMGCTRGGGVGVSIDVVPISPKIVPQGGIPRLIHAAKFLCGTIEHSANPQMPPEGEPLVPGTYLTAINIHNPRDFEVVFTKKAVVTNPQGQERGRVGEPVKETLGPNQGLEVDCGNIHELLGMPSSPSFLKGFVVITNEINIELDVVAVYTLKNVHSN